MKYLKQLVNFFAEELPCSAAVCIFLALVSLIFFHAFIIGFWLIAVGVAKVGREISAEEKKKAKRG